MNESELHDSNGVQKVLQPPMCRRRSCLECLHHIPCLSVNLLEQRDERPVHSFLVGIGWVLLAKQKFSMKLQEVVYICSSKHSQRPPRGPGSYVAYEVQTNQTWLSQVHMHIWYGKCLVASIASGPQHRQRRVRCGVFVPNECVCV